MAERREFPADRLPRRRRASCDAGMAGGTIVRDLRANPALPHALRISVGTRAQNDALLASLEVAMSGGRILFLDRDGTLERGAARRAGRQAGEDPPDAGRDAGAARTEARRIRLRHGHESGRTRHPEPAARDASSARIGSSWSCSPRRASSSTRCSSARISSTRTAAAASRGIGMLQEYLADASPRPRAQLHDRRPRHRPANSPPIWASQGCASG